MEEALLIQSFDSLWFFSSVCSSRKTKPNVQYTAEEEEDPRKPIKPIPHSDQNESPRAEFIAETEPKKSSASVLGVAVEEAEVQNPAAKKEEKIRRRKRRRRKILGELELGVDWRFNYEIEERCNGLGIYGIRQKHLVKMPPLSDGMAMKEHIKSWAYAVACTVR